MSIGKQISQDYCPNLKELINEEGEIYSWEHYDSNVGKWFRIKNCLIRQNDILYRVGNVNLIEDMMALEYEAVSEIANMRLRMDEKNRIHELLEYDASHDRLTGIFNRNRYMLDMATKYYRLYGG